MLNLYFCHLKTTPKRLLSCSIVHGKLLQGPQSKYLRLFRPRGKIKITCICSSHSEIKPVLGSWAVSNQCWTGFGRWPQSADHVDKGLQLCGRPPGKSWPRGSISGPPTTYLPWVFAAFLNDLRASGVKKVSSLEAHILTVVTTPQLTEDAGEQAEMSPLHVLHRTRLGLIRCFPTRRSRVPPHSPCWSDPHPLEEISSWQALQADPV